MIYKTQVFALSLIVFLSSRIGDSWSEEIARYHNTDYVFLCSGRAEINANKLQEFYAHAFPKEKSPVFVDDHSITLEDKDSYVLLLISKKPIDNAVADCLYRFPDFWPKYKSAILSQVEQVGTVPDFLKEQPLGESYEPIKANWKYIRESNDIFVSFISVESDTYFMNHALSGFFGLDIEACDDNPACRSPN